MINARYLTLLAGAGMVFSMTAFAATSSFRGNCELYHLGETTSSQTFDLSSPTESQRLSFLKDGKYTYHVTVYNGTGEDGQTLAGFFLGPDDNPAIVEETPTYAQALTASASKANVNLLEGFGKDESLICRGQLTVAAAPK